MSLLTWTRIINFPCHPFSSNTTRKSLWSPNLTSCLPYLYPLLISLPVHKCLRVPLTVFPVSGPSALLSVWNFLSVLVDVANSYSYFRVTQLWLICDLLYKEPLPLPHTSVMPVFLGHELHLFTILPPAPAVRMPPPPPTSTRAGLQWTSANEETRAPS